MPRMRRVLHKIKPYSLFVVCSLVVAAVSVAAQLYIPILCGNAIDFMLGKGSVNLSAVLNIVVEIIVVAVAAAFAQWLLQCLQQPHHVLRQPRPPQRGHAQDPDPAPLLPRQPPLRRHRQPDGSRCGHLCRRPAHGLHPAVLGRADHSGHPAVHAVPERAHHAGGGLCHPVEPRRGKFPRQAQLQVFPGPEHRPW